MTAAGDWDRLARSIEDDDAVIAAVRKAIDSGGDPWDALLDGLDEVGVLAYLQADDTGVELADALAQMPRVFVARTNLDDVANHEDLIEATEIADVALRRSGLRVVRLVEDDDSWPLVVLPEGQVRDVVEAATELGYEIVVVEQEL